MLAKWLNLSLPWENSTPKCVRFLPIKKFSGLLNSTMSSWKYNRNCYNWILLPFMISRTLRKYLILLKMQCTNKLRTVNLFSNKYWRSLRFYPMRTLLAISLKIWMKNREISLKAWWNLSNNNNLPNFSLLSQDMSISSMCSMVLETRSQCWMQNGRNISPKAI